MIYIGRNIKQKKKENEGEKTKPWTIQINIFNSLFTVEKIHQKIFKP